MGRKQPRHAVTCNPYRRLAPHLSAFLHVHQRLEAVILFGDPLHVVGTIWTTSAQRRDVVNVIAGAGAAMLAGGWACVFCAEGSYLSAVSVCRPNPARIQSKSRQSKKTHTNTPKPARRAMPMCLLCSSHIPSFADWYSAHVFFKLGCAGEVQLSWINSVPCLG